VKVIITILFFICALDLNSQDAEKNYSIFFPPSFPTETRDDIIYLLKQSMHVNWKQASSPKDVNVGIILDYKDNPAFKVKESFRLESNGSSQLIITASTTEGLIFGIYKHLRSLGFKFYLPDDLYTIVPTIKNPFGDKKDIVDQPYKQIRNFFGTGGFGSGRTDPDHSVEQAWNLWKLRNGFGTAYGLGGHRGENFILENQDLLARHPDWLASPLKPNGQLNTSAKLNYLNKEAVDYYTDWTISTFKNNFKPSSANVTEFASIEPSDGGGFLNELQPGNKKLPSISDQVFGTANVAAAKLDKLFPNNPNIGVNLYAYSSHAEPPSFPLHSRVFVQIVPYQFQNIAYGPAFIKRWSSKVKRFGLYDYYKYPDNSWDVPAGYTIDELMMRALQAGESQSEGTHYETSYSKFATAIPLWLVNLYLSNGDKDWEKNYLRLIDDLYGNAAPSIKKLFRLFYRQSKFDLIQMNSAISFLLEAEKMNKDPKISQRLAELKLYLVYVHLYMRSRNEKNGSFDERMLSLEKIAWTLYETKIIHSYRIMQLVSYSFLDASSADPGLASRYKQLHSVTFPDTDDPAALWKKDYKYTTTEIENIFNNAKSTENTAPEIQLSSISDQIKISKLTYSPKKDLSIGGNYMIRGYFTLYAEKPIKISVRWSLTNKIDPIPVATISGTEKEYKTVYDFPLKGNSGNITISIPAGESDFFITAGTNTFYRVDMELNGAYCFFKSSPRGNMIFYNSQNDNSYDPVLYPSYFFMPQNVSEVQYKVQLDALKIIAPDGKPVTTKLLSQMHGGFEIRSFVPPRNQQGKIWKAVISANYNYEFLNIPDVYFLLKEK
jgi:hypothetical protein